MKTSTVLALSAAIGALAGLRTFTPPAVLSRKYKSRCLSPRKNALTLLGASKVASSLTKLAAGELLADKLPFTPSRLTAKPFAARIVSGAVCGAAICAYSGESIQDGAVLGGLGAIAGSLAGYQLRKKFAQNFPDLAVAVAEDIVAIGGSFAIASALSPGVTKRARAGNALQDMDQSRTS
jgi:uncharacterized membrane protein